MPITYRPARAGDLEISDRLVVAEHKQPHAAARLRPDGCIEPAGISAVFAKR